MKTPYKRIAKFVSKNCIFKNVEEAQNYIRKNETPDYIAIAGILYTMEEYDAQGRDIDYYNLRTQNRLDVRTENRYGKKGFEDAELTLTENYGAYRNDIVFAD